MNITSTVAIVPHYFDKRKSAGYASLGLGEGIALVSLPYLLKSALDTYGFRLTLLYCSPIAVLSLVGPIVFIPQQQPQESSVEGSSLLQSYFGSLKRLVSPFYLFNSLFWQGGLSGVLVTGFTYLVDVSNVSVALLCYSIMGIAYLVGSLSLVAVLLKVPLNHYIAQIVVNGALGAATVIMTFMNAPLWYYVWFAIMGVLYGATISNMTCLSSHLYHAKDVEYSYGFMQVFGGIGATFVPITAAIVKESYGIHTGMYYSGGMLVSAAVTLIIPALIQPKIWLPIKAEQTEAAIENNEAEIDAVSTASCELKNI